MDNNWSYVTLHYPDFVHNRRFVYTDDHGESLVEVKYPDRIGVGMKHVFVTDPVLAGAGRDDWLYAHSHKLAC